MKNIVFEGSAVALITPMNEDGSVNYKKLDELVNWHINNKTDAIVACGTTGESSTLSDDEHIKVIETVVKSAKGRIPIIAGTGSNNTKYALELSKEAENLGADAVLIVTPYYNKSSQIGLIKHYNCIANEISIPVIIYDIPSRTGCTISIDTFKELSKNPDIVAVKAASGDISNIARIANECGSDLCIYSGNDDQIIPIMSIGGKGVISVLANILPKQTHEMCKLYLEGDCKESTKLQLKYLDLIHALFIDVNPIPIKEAMNMLGFEVGQCRMPLCNLSDEKLDVLRLNLKNLTRYK